MRIRVCSHPTAHMWKLEESVFFFHHIGPRNGTLVVRLGSNAGTYQAVSLVHVLSSRVSLWSSKIVLCVVEPIFSM